MATLRLPLSLNASGVFELSAPTDPIVRDRIRLFLLSGAGEYARLPSRGVREFWAHLFTAGSGGDLRRAMEEKAVRNIEKLILNEINGWLQGIGTVEDVTVLGDEHSPNGIRFSTDNEVVEFTFLLSRATKLTGIIVGPFTMIEKVHDVR